jgi:GGDEF domain-containing protein
MEVPGRSEAEHAVSEACRQGRPAFAAVFVADKLLAISERLGYAAGDKLLLDFSRHWAESLRYGDKLYRWSGTSFLAVLRRDANWREVLEEIEELASAPCQAWLDCTDGQVPVALNAKVELLATAGVVSGAEIVRAIDYFVAANVS